MVNDSYFRFDDDNKIKYKILTIIMRELAKLRSYVVIIINHKENVSTRRKC